jgi:hypothetical protein
MLGLGASGRNMDKTARDSDGLKTSKSPAILPCPSMGRQAGCARKFRTG